MPKRALIAATLLCVLCAACGSSSPTAPAPITPTPTPTPTPPPVVSMITVSACPDAVPGLDLGFYREIGCNAFDLPLTTVRRWNVAPKVYLRTIDEAGAPIDAVTLDTVQNAMIDVAPKFTAGRFGLEGVLRGTDTREGQTGWITVKWPTTTTGACGSSDVAKDGGTIQLRYLVPNCDFGCHAGAIRPRTVRHELGHALGYWHTDNPNDLMVGNSTGGAVCDAQPSARELAAIAYQYR